MRNPSTRVIVIIVFIGVMLLLTTVMALPTLTPAPGVAHSPMYLFSTTSPNSSVEYNFNAQMSIAQGGPQPTPAEGEPTGEPNTLPQKRVILRNASLSIEADDTLQAVSEINKLADEFGGFVVQSSTSQRNFDGKPQFYGSIALRVPAEKLSEALSRIRALASTVVSDEITGDDITQKYVDLGSQLDSLQAEEAQLKKIMESAQKTEDVLNVHEHLSSVQQQISLIKGQLKYYDQASALSLITVSIVPTSTTSVTSDPQWQPLKTLEGAVTLLGILLRGLVDLLIYGVIVGLPLGIVVFVIYRVYRRVWTVRQAQPSESEIKPNNPA